MTSTLVRGGAYGSMGHLVLVNPDMLMLILIFIIKHKTSGGMDMKANQLS